MTSRRAPLDPTSSPASEGQRATLSVLVAAETRASLDALTAVLEKAQVAIAGSGLDIDVLMQQPSIPHDALVLAAAPEGRDRWPAVADARRATASAMVCVVEQVDWRAARALVGQGAQAVVQTAAIGVALVPAVVAAVAGQLVLPSELATQIARPNLSPREKQVLGMVVMGLRNAEIAQTLFISETTVKSHLAAAFAKLGVRSRTEASALILDPDHGLGIGILEISGEGAADRKPALPGDG